MPISNDVSGFRTERERIGELAAARKAREDYATKPEMERARRSRNEYTANPPAMSELLRALRTCLDYYQRPLEDRLEEQEKGIDRALVINLTRDGHAPGPTRGARFEDVRQGLRRTWPGIPEAHVRNLLQDAESTGVAEKKGTGANATWHPRAVAPLRDGAISIYDFAERVWRFESKRKKPTDADDTDICQPANRDSAAFDAFTGYLAVRVGLDNRQSWSYVARAGHSCIWHATRYTTPRGVEELDDITDIVSKIHAYFTDARMAELLCWFWAHYPAEAAEMELPKAAGDPGSPGLAGEVKAAGDRADIDKPTLTMAILLREPEIAPTMLAKRVGVSPGTLYSKSEKWKHVRQTLLARGDAPRGKRSNGQVEAWAESTDVDSRE